MDCLPVPLGNYLLMATSRRTVKAIQIQRRIQRCQISIVIFALKKREYIISNHSCAPDLTLALPLSLKIGQIFLVRDHFILHLKSLIVAT
jgi:hypothetical protein